MFVKGFDINFMMFEPTTLQILANVDKRSTLTEGICAFYFAYGQFWSFYIWSMFIQFVLVAL